MKTIDEYKLILAKTIQDINTKYPNWNFVQDDYKFYSLFSRCLPPELSVEDIVIVCSLFFKKSKGQPI